MKTIIFILLCVLGVSARATPALPRHALPPHHLVLPRGSHGHTGGSRLGDLRPNHRANPPAPPAPAPLLPYL